MPARLQHTLPGGRKGGGEGERERERGREGGREGGRGRENVPPELNIYTQTFHTTPKHTNTSTHN